MVRYIQKYQWVIVVYYAMRQNLSHILFTISLNSLITGEDDGK